MLIFLILNDKSVKKYFQEKSYEFSKKYFSGSKRGGTIKLLKISKQHGKDKNQF
jgi:hypothetical protein